MSGSSSFESPSAIVLAGGSSRRMGEPKALLRFGELTLVERVVDRLADVCSSIVVVAQEGLDLPSFPPRVRVVRDPLPDAGPLVGLAAGLSELEGSFRWAFVCAVDAPFVSAAVVARLVALARDCDAVVPQFEGDTYPLTALYACSVAETARELVRDGERRARILAQVIRSRFVGKDELLADADVSASDPELLTFFNVNTPSDWETALARRSAVDRRAPKRD